MIILAGRGAAKITMKMALLHFYIRSLFHSNFRPPYPTNVNVIVLELRLHGCSAGSSADRVHKRGLRVGMNGGCTHLFPLTVWIVHLLVSCAPLN
jgi:hypothetical protein